MKKNTKKIFHTSALFFALPFVTMAADYDPITPLVPGNVNDFINWFIQTAIGIGSALAVLMIVVGGFRILLMAGNPSARSAAKEMMFNALFGLGILILSYLILNSINPDMVSFSF